MRVASSVPALTETLYALGVQPVAVSSACDYPPPVASTPSFIEPRIDESADAATIDAQVADLMEDSGSLYRIDDSVLVHTNPDLILTEGTCEVCAVTDDQISEAVDRVDIEPAVHSFHPHTLSDTLEIVNRLGSLLEADEEATRLLRNLRRRIAGVKDRASDRTRRPRTLVLDWTDPPMAAGHWTPELVELAGGEPLLATAGRPAGTVEWDSILDVDPEILILAPCGFDCARGVDALDTFRGYPGWEDISAVKQDRIYVLDGTQLINRPGPRLIDTLELIESVLVGPPSKEPDSQYVVAPPVSG